MKHFKFLSFIIARYPYSIQTYVMVNLHYQLVTITLKMDLCKIISTRINKVTGPAPPLIISPSQLHVLHMCDQLMSPI